MSSSRPPSRLALPIITLALCAVPAAADPPAWCDGVPASAPARRDAATPCLCGSPYHHSPGTGFRPAAAQASPSGLPATTTAAPAASVPPGVYSQPAATGDELGESTGFGIRGLAIRIPEIRLELPEVRLPSLFRVRRGPQMRTDATTAAFVTHQAATYRMTGAGGHFAASAAPQTASAAYGFVQTAPPAGPFTLPLVSPSAAPRQELVPKVSPRFGVRSGCAEGAGPPAAVQGGLTPRGSAGDEPPPAPAPTGMLPLRGDASIRAAEKELTLLHAHLERQNLELERLYKLAASQEAAIREIASKTAVTENALPTPLPALDSAVSTLITPAAAWEPADIFD